jgi:hypothetical protein
MMRLRLPARHSLVCQQAVELVTDYLEGALSRADYRRFEKHLAKCTGRVTPDDLTEQMRGEFIDLYRRWQHEDDAEDQG